MSTTPSRASGTSATRWPSGLRGRTKTLGLLLPDLTNSITVETARGVETIAGDAGYGLFLCNTEEQPKRQRAYIRMLLEHQVAGILINPVNGTADDVALLHERGIPLVALGYQASTVPVELGSTRLRDGRAGRQWSIWSRAGTGALPSCRVDETGCTRW